MWPGPGKRGGPPFRGDHHAEMFRGREHPMLDYRGRDMNVGPLAPRPLDVPPMDMRRMDGPPMRGHDLDHGNIHGREPSRDYSRFEDRPEFDLRWPYESGNRDQLMSAPGFRGPGGNLDMGGRGPPRQLNDRFMNTGDEDLFLDNPHMDRRSGFPMERMEHGERFRDMHDRPPTGSGDSSHYMDMPQQERRMMDIDRRGPPVNLRGFDSDMDFRHGPGSSAHFTGRDRSPIRFGNDNLHPGERARMDLSADVDARRPEFMGPGDGHEREYLDARGDLLMDYRSGEEMTLAEEWKHRKKDNPYYTTEKSVGSGPKANFPPVFPPSFQEKEKSTLEFPEEDASFSHGDHYLPKGLSSIGNKGAQNQKPQDFGPLPGTLGEEKEGKHWESKHIYNKSDLNERLPFYDKTQQLAEVQHPSDRFKNITQHEDPVCGKQSAGHDFHNSSNLQPKDQDYRDIDYRTGSSAVFEFKREKLPAQEKILNESTPIPPPKLSNSGSQDQDYRNASIEEKVSNVISITGIPKTATTEQILGAFAVRDGVPMQGMKIRNVVPGYSSDMAYVEFLNIEDAVRFMESNKGSLKVGSRTTSMNYIQPEKCERSAPESDHQVPVLPNPSLPRPDIPLGSEPKEILEPFTPDQWQRSSDLTPEAWQQQVDQQLHQEERDQEAKGWSDRNPPRQTSHQSDPVFKDSKTMIIKNVKATTTVETILKALDPFAYLDERNVRLVKGKQPGSNGFCFVDMDSHEQVTRLVELLTKPRPLYIDGVRVYAQVAKPLKNQSFRKDQDKPNISILGYPPESSMLGQHQHLPMFTQPLPPPYGSPAGVQGDFASGLSHLASSTEPRVNQELGGVEAPAVDQPFQGGGPHMPEESATMAAATDGSQAFACTPEIPDISGFLYDATSGFYYDPETTLYYDPNSRYFYNAQTQEYMYWDAPSKTYVAVPGEYSAENQPVIMTAEDQAILSNPAADAPLEMRKPSETSSLSTDEAAVPAAAPSIAAEAAPPPAEADERNDDDDSSKRDKEKDGKEDKPKSLAAVKIMKDMERWAKIQNRQKDSARAPSPMLRSGMDDDKRQSKSADAGFAIFERKIGGEDLFKKPLAPPKKDEKSKRVMGSLGMLASDYAAGSDEEVEEDKEETTKPNQSTKSSDKEDKLTDWKKMACLLCRRQFPNKDALVRHQQLSDLHKQNMEIHLKIKRSKKELEALENQEKELKAGKASKSPEPKKKKQHHQQAQHHNTWAGTSRETNKVSDRPGLGAVPAPRKKKEHVVWDHATYKQAVRKAMFARFKELE
ncbi:RNA-binding protein 6 isoform X2 [Gouania willdenowi]|uniref:RNA-binding protein 6 isoform X2 n=1 Tax=Gouania willdenowi TaxID=441366 RepID=UPI001054E51E|nr:RNA-binding protein 6-like isoform X2 [Gouania willdenowi]